MKWNGLIHVLFVGWCRKPTYSEIKVWDEEAEEGGCLGGHEDVGDLGKVSDTGVYVMRGKEEQGVDGLDGLKREQGKGWRH